MNTLLSIALCITLASCSNNQGQEPQQTQSQTELQQGSYDEVSEREFRELWKKGEGVLLDVRTPAEYAEGHLPGAKRIDYMGDNFKSEISKLNRDTTYLVYCRSGRRSQLAGEEMRKMGFNVINLNGGIISWNNKGFEIEK